jgi:hypothetical protein
MKMNGARPTNTPTTPKSSETTTNDQTQQQRRGIAEIAQRVKEIVGEFKTLQNAPSFQANVEAIVTEHPDPVKQLPSLTVALMLEVKKQHAMEGSMKKALVLAIVDLVIFRFAPAGTHDALHAVADASIDVMFTLSSAFKESKFMKSLKCCC